MINNKTEKYRVIIRKRKNVGVVRGICMCARVYKFVYVRARDHVCWPFSKILRPNYHS